MILLVKKGQKFRERLDREVGILHCAKAVGSVAEGDFGFFGGFLITFNVSYIDVLDDCAP